METRFGCDGRKIVQGRAGATRAQGLERIPSREREEGGIVTWAMGDLQGARALVLHVLC